MVQTIFNLAITPRLHQALLRACDEAAAEDRDWLGVEHVLVALAQDPDGIAGRALAAIGGSEPAIRYEVTRQIRSLHDRASDHKSRIDAIGSQAGL